MSSKQTVPVLATLTAVTAVVALSLAIATPSVDAISKHQSVTMLPRADISLARPDELGSHTIVTKALVERGDVASTRTYILAYYALVRTAKAKLPVQQAAAATLVREISSQCSGVLAGAPHNEASAELGLEVLGAVSIVMFDSDRPAVTRFVRTVKSLRWSSSKLARTVKAYTTKLRAEAALTVPDSCSDMKVWAATGFRALPMTVTRFNQKVKAAEKGPQEISSQLLAPYADIQGKAVLRKIKRLETEIEGPELDTGLHASSEIFKAVGLSTESQN